MKRTSNQLGGRGIAFTLIELLACRGEAYRAKRSIRFTPSLLNRRRFTLIELLVAIAIIAILAAILLPVLGRVKHQAKRVVCINNQKNLSLATFLYLDEYDSCYPVVSSAPHNPWYSLIGKQSGSGTCPAEDRPLNPYLANSIEVSECPDDRGQSSTFASWENGSGLSVYDQLGFSYGFAQHGDYFGIKALVKHGTQAPVKASNLKGPLEKKLLLSEYNYFANRPWVNGVNRWHSYDGNQYGRGRIMVTSFADGHTEYFAFPADYESRSAGHAADPSSELW